MQESFEILSSVSENSREDEVLRRMLNTPPKPHKPKGDSAKDKDK